MPPLSHDPNIGNCSRFHRIEQPAKPTLNDLKDTHWRQRFIRRNRLPAERDVILMQGGRR